VVVPSAVIPVTDAGTGNADFEPRGLCGSPLGYPSFMTDDATDPTGERLRDPEGPDTPHGKPPPDDEKKEPEPRPG
jgi:hypothetical protein